MSPSGSVRPLMYPSADGARDSVATPSMLPDTRDSTPGILPPSGPGAPGMLPSAGAEVSAGIDPDFKPSSDPGTKTTGD